MAARDSVSLLVLPRAAGAHPAVMVDSTILKFAELIAPDVVNPEKMTPANIYIETPGRDFAV